MYPQKSCSQTTMLFLLSHSNKVSEKPSPERKELMQANANWLSSWRSTSSQKKLFIIPDKGPNTSSVRTPPRYGAAGILRLTLVHRRKEGIRGSTCQPQRAFSYPKKEPLCSTCPSAKAWLRPPTSHTTYSCSSQQRAEFEQGLSLPRTGPSRARGAGLGEALRHRQPRRLCLGQRPVGP